ncbi:MAG: methyltransferase [SAR202 cluster bacterium]|nr:methyltransferase [SAR202 cluster bacterium]
MSLVSEELEKYSTEHTTQIPAYMQELIRVTHEKAASPQMLSGPIEGMLLQTLAYSIGARRILEFGAFTGFSALMMAEALPDDGVIITCDVNPETSKIAREFFKKSPHGHKIDLRLGNALDTVKTLKGPIDMVFIDADKENYSNYYEASMNLLSTRGIIVVDNVLWSGRVLKPEDASSKAIAAFNERVRNDRRVKHVLLPVRNGVMVIRKA